MITERERGRWGGERKEEIRGWGLFLFKGGVKWRIMSSLINSSGCMTHRDKTKPLINAWLKPELWAKQDIPCRWRWECLYKHKVWGFDWVGRWDGLKNEVHYSPSLVSHAPRLPHAALLPHFNHACEGLHTWLPLGDQRHLSLHTHIGPGRKTVLKILKVSKCCAVFLQMYRWRWCNLWVP